MLSNGSRRPALALLMLLATLLATMTHSGPSKSAAAADDKIKDLLKSLGQLEIKLLEAKVPDLDPYPGQKDSDVFVRVFLNNTKELVCETPIIQDENQPQFNKECKLSRPVPADTVLRVELYDSDKPVMEPDWIGMSKIKVSDLILNRKLDSKEKFPIEGREFPKYYIRAEIDFKPAK